MSREACGLSSPSAEHKDDDDDDLRSSPVIIIDNDRNSLYDANKVADHILQQFFNDVHTGNDGIKSAQCLLCRVVIKQSAESTFNYKRHIERRHTSQLDRWRAALIMKKKIGGNKQLTVRECFLRKRESLIEVNWLEVH